nr:unnamed protein product [Callosobruchus chinensis]
MLPVVLEKTFVHQQQLKYLCLARNRLAKITNTAFFNLTSLIELDISYNRLSKLESDAVTPLADSLQKLVISGNYFTLGLIKALLQTLYRVWHLEAAHMRLKFLPDRFIPDRVKYMNISWNNLTTLTPQIFPAQLQQLDLSHNQLIGLNDSVVVKLETLKHVNLTGNPWSCTLCHITSMLFRVNKTNMFMNLTCASPDSLRGRTIPSLRFEDVTTCGSKQNSDTSVSNGKLGLLVGLILIVISAVFAIVFVVVSCIRRHYRNVDRQRKREAVERAENSLQNATAIFSKGEISFKFPLDLMERKMSVSTIDEIKRDPQPSLPNGTSTGI